MKYTELQELALELLYDLHDQKQEQLNSEYANGLIDRWTCDNLTLDLGNEIENYRSKILSPLTVTTRPEQYPDTYTFE